MKGFENVPVDWAPASSWTDDDGNQHHTVEFIVPGTPRPKGNVIKGRYGGYHDPTKGLSEWLSRVKGQAVAAMKGRSRIRDYVVFVDPDPGPLPLLDGPVMVDVTFVMPRPKATPKSKTPPAIRKPDTDKLLRAVLDAMTGVVFADDAQVVEAYARKRLAGIDEHTGAYVLVTTNVRVPVELDEWSAELRTQRAPSRE